MKLADKNMKAVAMRKNAALMVVGAALLPGCIFLEPPPDMPSTTQSVVIRSLPNEPSKDVDFGAYLVFLQGLTPEALAAELSRMAKDEQTKANVQQQFRYALAMSVRSFNERDYATALSPLGDTSKRAEANSSIEGWSRFLQKLLARLDSESERQGKITQERRDSAKINESLTKQVAELNKELADKKAAIDRLEKQLNELKSIETSITKRQAEEDVKKP